MPERYNNKPQLSEERQHPFFPPMMFDSQPAFPRRPHMHRRRDATSVMAGYFDPTPERDILTSYLNNIGPYFAVEKSEEEIQRKKMEKRVKDRERKRRQREEARAANRRLQDLAATPAVLPSSSSVVAGKSFQPESSSTSSSKQVGRPTIHIPAMQRSFSVTPTPPSSPHFVKSGSSGSTPGPSASSGTSRTSSKRPHTPYDEEVVTMRPPTPPPRPRKKRLAVKKGWKGWVEGSPEPSGKLINLDAVPMLQERRTRSGKNFDAISVGKDSWV